METITIGGEGEDGQNAGQEVGEVEEGEEEDTLPNQCKVSHITYVRGRNSQGSIHRWDLLSYCCKKTEERGL